MNSRFEQLLDEKISNRIQNHVDFLAQSGAKNYDQYQYYCGLIAGLKEIATLCDEVRSDMSK